MRHISQKILTLLLFLLLLGHDSEGQCTFEGDLIIQDQDTTSIPIFVSGAVNNDLAANNGLKTVTLHFKHEFIGDLLIELVSPSGQKVTLVGPMATLSPSTSLVTCWNVEFFANSLTAFPDSGYDTVWNSLQTWLGFTTYSGKYYPHLGMLEDFDIGPVNGTWTLNIIDNVQFGKGHVYCFDLTFCEEDGINEDVCSLVAHSLSGNSVIACEEDPSLDLPMSPDFAEEYDDSVYGYSYVVIKNGAFHSIIPDLDLTTFDAGEYEICGILYFSGDFSSLNSIPTGSTKEEFADFITENGFCASFSDDCISVVIEPIPEMVTEEVSICFGDSIVIGNTVYNEEGIYEIVTSMSPCDSISMLDLQVNNVDVQVESLSSQLTCDNPSTQISGELTEMPDGATFGWSSGDGNIISRPDSLVIEVDQGGIYTFEVVVGECVFSQDVEIDVSDDFVNVALSANVLTCLLDSTFIDLTVSDTIDSISWTGPFDFSILNEDIRVGSGGIYAVNLITNHGCEISREIEVIEERVFPNLSIVGDTLSCTKSAIVLQTTPVDTLNSSFQWFEGGIPTSNDTFLTVTNPGDYSLVIESELGCADTVEFEVISQFRVIDAELVNDTIDCNNPFVTLAYTSSIANMNSLWKLPNGELVIDSSFNTSQSGLVTLELSDSLGCTLDTSFVVGVDSLLPEIFIPDASFLCGDDSIQLLVQANFDELTYIWTKPDGLTIEEKEPFITSPGLYILDACRANGCCVTDSVMVGVDVSAPTIEFDFSNLDCRNDTTYIIPSDTSSYLMEWRLNGFNLPVDSNIIEVTTPGFYEVLVTDEDNGCKSQYSFDITSDMVVGLESLNADILNCAIKEVQILVESPRTFESFEWNGPGLLDGNIEPNVDEPGLYILTYTFSNGCSGIDSIEVIKEGELPNLQGEDVIITCKETEVSLDIQYSSSSIALAWSGPGNFEATGTPVMASEPGIYTVIGVASGSCRDTFEIELIADTLSPMISIIEDGEITCADSIVAISAQVDLTTEFYEISGPDVSDPQDLNFEVDVAGMYTIEATAFNGCVAIESVVVTQSTDFPMYTIDLDSITCVEQQVDVGFVSPDPSLDVVWDGPINIADDTYGFTTEQAGNYVFSLTNSNGCKLTDSFFVVMDTFPPDSEITLSSHINCINESAVLGITNYDPNVDVQWTGPGVIDPGAASITTTAVGEYLIVLTARNGCVTEDQIVVEYDTLSPEISIVGDPINCAAGKTFLRVETDLILDEYDWTGPNDFMSGEAEPLIFEEGTYFVTVTALNGCISNDTIEIEDERVFPEIEVGDFFLPCDDTPEPVFTSFMSEGSFVRWFGPNDFFSEGDTAFVLVPGEYIGIAFNAEGCTTSDTFMVIDEPVLPIFGGFSELLLCQGPVEITATDIEDDGFFYWNGPDDFYSEENPAMVEEPGVYQLIVFSDKGCIDSMDVEVVDGRIFPDAVTSVDGLFQCENTEVLLSGAGSSDGNLYSYEWSTEDGNIIQGQNSLHPRINQEGTYILAVTNNSIGCTTYDTLLVMKQEQDLRGVELEILKPTCLNYGNAEINLTGVVGGYGPFNIFVDDFDYGERTNIQYLKVGDHMISIVDSLGCQIDTLVNISEEGVLFVELPSDTTLCFGDSILIEPKISIGEDSISSILWSSNVGCNGCSFTTIFPDDDMTITIEVVDINGCVEEAEMHIKVDRPNNLPFPQIFSPNGDGVNDVFYMPMTKGLQNIDYIKIYDNWGGLLYEENNLEPGNDSRGWKGTVNGQDVEQGVYIIEAMVTLVNGTQIPYVSELTLVR